VLFAAERLIIRTPTCPRCAACTEPSLLIHHAVVVSPHTAGVKGVSHLQLFLFLVFLSPEKEKGEALTMLENLCRKTKPIHPKFQK